MLHLGGQVFCNLAESFVYFLSLFANHTRIKPRVMQGLDVINLN